MDDFGYSYMDADWYHGCEQFATSMSTFGLMDDMALEMCIWNGGLYWAQEV